MSPFRKNIRIAHLVIAGHLVAMVLLVFTCDLRKSEDKLPGVVHFSGREFAGSENCVECHPSIAESHSQTPHFLTSRPADAESVKGSFDPGENVFRLDDGLKIVMEKDSAGLVQRGFVDSFEVDRKPMHITIGSGRKGQSYLYWENNFLFQLPVSYYTPLDVWCNSPGYPPDQILFNRNITARCLECHSTYFKTTKSVGGIETFDQNQVMIGIDCERCHGPAADHVTFHRDHPGGKKAKHIINPARLSRQQKLDNCALCHSGIRENFLPAFSYVVGDDLNDYFFPDRPADSTSDLPASAGPTHRQAGLDVHGNQYGLLTASKCFRRSSMDCSSCHNVHARETNQLGLFSTRCKNCHTREGDHFCKQPEIPGLVLDENCIDCHMPALPSRKVLLQAPKSYKSTPFLVRTHLIATYPDQVKSFLEKIQAENPAE